MYKFKKTEFSSSFSKAPGDAHTLEVNFLSVFSPSDFLGEIILWVKLFAFPRD